MYPVGVAVLLLIVILWLLILSFLLWRQENFLKGLFPKDRLGDVKQKLEEVLLDLEATRREEQILNKNIRDVVREGLGHLQKVYLLRYNPYGDTGGDMSFSIACLDGKGDGFVLTSLHTRSGTRIYAKEVVSGKSELKLSKEETQVLNQALS